MEDLRVHPLSKISDIAERIPDIDMKEIRKMLYSMVGKEIEKEGTRFDSKYYIILHCERICMRQSLSFHVGNRKQK